MTSKISRLRESDGLAAAWPLILGLLGAVAIIAIGAGYGHQHSTSKVGGVTIEEVVTTPKPAVVDEGDDLVDGTQTPPAVVVVESTPEACERSDSESDLCLSTTNNGGTEGGDYAAQRTRAEEAVYAGQAPSGEGGDYAGQAPSGDGPDYQGQNTRSEEGNGGTYGR